VIGPPVLRRLAATARIGNSPPHRAGCFLAFFISLLPLLSLASRTGGTGTVNAKDHSKDHANPGVSASVRQEKIHPAAERKSSIDRQPSHPPPAGKETVDGAFTRYTPRERIRVQASSSEWRLAVRTETQTGASTVESIIVSGAGRQLMRSSEADLTGGYRGCSLARSWLSRRACSLVSQYSRRCSGERTTPSWPSLFWGHWDNCPEMVWGARI